MFQSLLIHELGYFDQTDYPDQVQLTAGDAHYAAYQEEKPHHDTKNQTDIILMEYLD